MDPFIQTQIGDLIGKTPMMRLDRLGRKGQGTILAKLEYLNPGGSVKDRIARSMIDAAETEGWLQPGMGIVEATSGNTGIGLAMICAERGYRLILTMPETMSFERRSLVIRYGAEVVLTPGKEDIPGAVRRARRLVERNPGWIELRQFENPANPQVHRGDHRTRDPGGDRRERRRPGGGRGNRWNDYRSRRVSEGTHTPTSGSSPSSRPARPCSAVGRRDCTPSRGSAPGSFLRC